MTLSPTLDRAITRYLKACAHDYLLCHPTVVPDRQPSYRLDVGRKFVRIWRLFPGMAPSAHAFVNVRHPKFAEGDLLMAATWRGPALNQSRGNVFHPESYTAQWYGVPYLR